MSLGPVDGRTPASMPISITTTTTTTTAATPTAPATITPAPAAGRPLLTRPRFINGQRAPLEILLMKHRNGLVGILLRAHLDESKPTRPARGAILHDIDRDNRACLRKVILQIVLRHGEG